MVMGAGLVFVYLHLLSYSFTAIDVAFQESVENFVIDSRSRPVYIKQYLPDQIYDIYQDLNSNCYKCRTLAKKMFFQYFDDHPGKIRYLYWLLRSKNAEIHSVAFSILQKINQCGRCFGSGECLPNPYDYHYWSNCKNCGGLGRLFGDEIEFD